MKGTAPGVSADSLRTRLKLKSFESKALFLKKHPHAVKYFKFKGFDLGKVRDHSAKLLSTSALAGALLLSGPGDVKYLPTPQEILGKLKLGGDNSNGDSNETRVVVNKRQVLNDALKKSLPAKTRPLTREEEKLLERVFAETLGVPARATLEGEHLNQTFGYVGAEQHLRRYPGDSISLHGNDAIKASGMAPGLGAWGYFSSSKTGMSEDLIEKEKWYFVVQTLYLPDWNRRQLYLKEWYKFRKVLVVNTENGNAVIADIADSGPAAWTGKHYGGSPEVMDSLGGPKYRKGPVVVFFVDDPNNQIPLGPVEY